MISMKELDEAAQRAWEVAEVLKKDHRFLQAARQYGRSEGIRQVMTCLGDLDDQAEELDASKKRVQKLEAVIESTTAEFRGMMGPHQSSHDHYTDLEMDLVTRVKKATDLLKAGT